jgi:hypothetical protein
MSRRQPSRPGGCCSARRASPTRSSEDVRLGRAPRLRGQAEPVGEGAAEQFGCLASGHPWGSRHEPASSVARNNGRSDRSARVSLRCCLSSNPSAARRLGRAFLIVRWGARPPLPLRRLTYANSDSRRAGIHARLGGVSAGSWLALVSRVWWGAYRGGRSPEGRQRKCGAASRVRGARRRVVGDSRGGGLSSWFSESSHPREDSDAG